VTADGSRFVSASRRLLLDFTVAPPRGRHYGVMNARRERVVAVEVGASPATTRRPSATSTHHGAAWATSDGGAAGAAEAGHASWLSWPVARMQNRLVAATSITPPGAVARAVVHPAVAAEDSMQTGRLVMRPATTMVYQAYSIPLEQLPWLQSHLDVIQLSMPALPALGDVVGGLLMGRSVLWLDASWSLTLLHFAKQRDGSLVPRPAHQVLDWTYAGQLLASLSLVPAETAFQLFVAELGGEEGAGGVADGSPVAHGTIARAGRGLSRSFDCLDRYDLLRYHVYGTGYRAVAADPRRRPAVPPSGGEASDAATLISVDAGGDATPPPGRAGAGVNDVDAGPGRLIPPWLAVTPEWVPRDAAPTFLPANASGAFARLRARVVVYRGYDLYGPGGELVRPFLRVRVEGNGISPDDDPTCTWAADMDAVASGAMRIADGEAAGGVGGEGDGDAGDVEGGPRDGFGGDERADGGTAAGADAQQATAHPLFGREFLVDACIPGRCSLVVEVVYGGLLPGAAPRVLGHTRINLERRWNSPIWRAVQRDPPVEMRSVYAPVAEASGDGVAGRQPADADDNEATVVSEVITNEDLTRAELGRAGDSDWAASRVSRGRLKMWIALGPPSVPLPRPPVDDEGTRSGMATPWELRVVVWWAQQREKGSKVPVYVTGEVVKAGDGVEAARGLQPGLTGMTALRGEGDAGWLGSLFTGAAQKPSLEEQIARGAQYIARAYRTPQHHGRRGTGPDRTNLEFNWRMKFRVRVDDAALALPPRLRLRTWRPMGWPYSDHLLSEAVLDLEPMLRHARLTSQRQDANMQTVDMRPMGQYGTRGVLRVQVALVPEAAYQLRPVGVGRSLPNQDPFIPEPDIPPAVTCWERTLQWATTTGVCLLLLAAAVLVAILATRRPA